MRQRRDVVREEPADGDPQVLLVGPQALGPLGLSFRRASRRSPRAHRSTPRAASTSARSSLAARRSAANSRTAASMWNLGPASVGVDRDEAVPGERIEQIERPVLGEIGDVHGRLDRPPVDEDRQVASICCSASSSSPKLHSTVARSVRCRSGRSTGPVPKASRLRSSRASKAAGSSSRVRAAASSMASGDRRDAGRSPRWRRRCPRSGRSRGGPPGPIDEQLHGRQRGQLVGRRRVENAGTAARRPGTRARPAGEARCGSSPGSRRPGSEPGAGRARARHPRSCSRLSSTSRVGSSAKCSIRTSSAGARPRWSRPPPRRCGAAPARARSIGERHEDRPLRVAVVQSLAHRDRQPGLADAAGAGEGDQPDLG